MDNNANFHVPGAVFLLNGIMLLIFGNLNLRDNTQRRRKELKRKRRSTLALDVNQAASHTMLCAISFFIFMCGFISIVTHKPVDVPKSFIGIDPNPGPFFKEHEGKPAAHGFDRAGSPASASPASRPTSRDREAVLRALNVPPRPRVNTLVPPDNGSR